MRGQPIHTSNIPEAFWEWYERLRKKASYITMELVRTEISVVRTRVPVEDEKHIQGFKDGGFVINQ